MSSPVGSGRRCSGPQVSAGDDKLVTLKIRALIIDGHLKEYARGAPHDVTERLFAVRRAFRVNKTRVQAGSGSAAAGC